MSASRTPAWLAWLALCLGLATAFPASAQATLTEKQAHFLENAARGRLAGRWLDLDTNQLAVLRRTVDAYAAAIPRRHLVGGLVVSPRYADTNATQVTRYEELQDSSAWTGFYLAGLAYWFAVDRRGDTLEQIRVTLDGVERLLQSTPRPGYVPAFIGRADDPAYRAIYSTYGGADPARPGFGRLAFPGDATSRDLVWLGGASRDGYSGLVMGLAMVHKFVREPRIRARVADAAELIIRRLEEDHWRIHDGHGHETFVTPLLGAAILRLGASVHTNRYQHPYEARAADVVDMPPPVAPRYADQRAAVFAAANLATLDGLEGSKKLSLGYQDQVTRLWRDSGNPLNPWLAVVFVNAFDHAPSETIAIATLHGVLASYPPPPRWAGPGALASTNGLDLIAANGAVWAKNMLPLAQQGVVAFQWTRPGTSLEPVPAEPVLHPGVDLFVTYWMARDAGVLRDETAPIVAAGPGLRRPNDFRARTNVSLAFPAPKPVEETNAVARPRP